MTKRYWVILGIAVASAAIPAGFLVLRAHRRAAERGELLHCLLSPFSAQAEWDAMRRRGDVAIAGGPDHGTARVRATVTGRPSWWTYEYERREGWPQAARIPRRLREESSIVAAGQLRTTDPVQVTQQIVVAQIAAPLAGVQGLLATEGWETIPTDVKALFGWPESVSGMVCDMEDPDTTEAVALSRGTSTSTVMYWMYWRTDD